MGEYWLDDQMPEDRKVLSDIAATIDQGQVQITH